MSKSARLQRRPQPVTQYPPADHVNPGIAERGAQALIAECAILGIAHLPAIGNDRPQLRCIYRRVNDEVGDPWLKVRQSKPVAFLAGNFQAGDKCSGFYQRMDRAFHVFGRPLKDFRHVAGLRRPHRAEI